MKWSWQIGRIAGIDLKVHSTFMLILIWVGFSALLSGGNLTAALTNVLLILALFMCVVMHEFGHALTARIFGIKTRDITLLPIGGVARLEEMPEDPLEELLVAAAGPAVNVVISAALFSALLITGYFSQPLNLSMLTGNIWMQLLAANITLVFFNLIPAFPMDGGRVLRAILASGMDYVKATNLAANVGRGFAVLMGIAGFFLNPWLIATALFVWSGAGAEARTVQIKRDLNGLTARDALISKFYQVEANQSLESLFQLAMQTGQSHFPVVSNGVYLGIISRNDLMKTMDRLGSRSPAYAAISGEPGNISPETPLKDVMMKFGTNRTLPVVENRQLLGLVTPESVQHLIWYNKRMGNTRPRPPRENINPLLD